jgi:ferritin-like metal-binding protein YciE
MDASPDVLAESVRAKRNAVDNDLELLRVKIEKADPRRRFDRQRIAEVARRIAPKAIPAVAGAGGLWLWSRRRRQVNSLHTLLIHGLADLYDGERQLVPVLDRMRMRSSNEDLARAFEQHRAETEAHLDRLIRVFRSVGARPTRHTSTALSAIVEDGERLLSRKVDRDVRDAWLIATAQRVEHLEIANYGTVRTYADLLGFVQAAQLLQQTLEEERATDEKLTRLAERYVNPQSIRKAAVI